jgi:hypothetical protein
MPLLIGCLVSLGIKAAVVSAEAATVTRTGVCPARTRHGWLLGRKATVSPAKQSARMGMRPRRRCDSQ